MTDEIYIDVPPHVVYHVLARSCDDPVVKGHVVAARGGQEVMGGPGWRHVPRTLDKITGSTRTIGHQSAVNLPDPSLHTTQTEAPVTNHQTD